MIRIAIIAPALALRAGLRALLSAGGAGAVVSEAGSLAEHLAADVETDVLLLADGTLDESLLRRRLVGQEGRLGVLILSDDVRDAQNLSTLPVRGWGILPVDVSAEELQAGVRAVGEGLVVGTPALFAQAVRPLSISGDPGSGESLTEREGQVLQLLARGLANKQIALALGISEHTVKFHVSSIYAKLGAANRTEAVRTGVQRGLVLL